jgi:hypothetical protein
MARTNESAAAAAREPQSRAPGDGAGVRSSCFWLSRRRRRPSQVRPTSSQSCSSYKQCATHQPYCKWRDINKSEN